ncbi:major facilitator superfamily domain-containing protein [Myxozyma melibiosi]|uniref:Major facilitator superfamily domain-containing protein n=1 Tax=Myxozyma melibiosi TaxID=54550 RepID=A0ABR1FAS9_9ASCO
MAFGILEDNKLAHVPGTSLLDDGVLNSEGVNISNISEESAAHLKHATGKNSHIILIPQPSDDPNDPLNWSLLRRDCLFAIHSLGYVINVGVCGPILSAGTLVIANELNVTITDVAFLTGYQLLVIGAAGPFVSALSRVFGKRPQFIAASLFGLIGTIICCTANTYNVLLAGRIVQGLGNVAYESIVISVIGDLYCLHERGLRLAVFNFCFGGVNLFTSVIAGPITTRLGWRWLFYIDVIFVAIQAILMIFFSTETTYVRDAKFDIDVAGEELYDDIEKIGAAHVENPDKPESEQTEKALDATTIPQKKNYLQTIKPYHGRVSNENILRLVVRPFAVLSNPSVIWIVLAMSIPLAWIVNINYAMAQLYGVEPYNMDAEHLGYLAAGPFIGGFLASLFFFFVNDPMTLWISRKNRGVFEPEFKLPLGVAIGSACLTIGCFGYGNAYRDKLSAIVAAVMFGFVCAGSTSMAITASNYMIDAYRDLSVEIVIAAMSLKNFLFYGFSYFFNNWVASAGPDVVFDVLGGIALFTSLILSIPFYIYGKRIRSWWHRAQLLKRLKLA